MIAEDRIARIESDVAEIKDDVKVVNVRLNESIVANAREFGAARTELEKHRTDTEKGFGAIRVEIEKTKFWLFSTTIGTIVAILGGMVYLHTLKII